jgi:hypothetical protein
MPADLNQFRRHDTHGTIIGGKGLVQLGHDTADAGTLLYQIHLYSGVCQIKGSLHPTDPTAYYHSCANFIVIHLNIEY